MIKNNVLNKLNEKNLNSLLDNVKVMIYVENKYHKGTPINNHIYSNGVIDLTLREYISSLAEVKDFSEYEKCHHWYRIDYSFKSENAEKIYCLEFDEYIYSNAFGDDYISIESVVKNINEFLNSERFYSKVDEVSKKYNLLTDYSEKQLWKDSSKEYKDEEYVSITRINEDTKWGFDDLYDYLKENKSSYVYKIFNMRDNADVMYISKNNLYKMLDCKDINANMREDIKTILDREVNCCICKNTTYVNTVPYVYDDLGGCVGKFYACPICLDLYDLEISPNSNYTKNLNGEEKMDLLSYMNDRKIEFI